MLDSDCTNACPFNGLPGQCAAGLQASLTRSLTDGCLHWQSGARPLGRPKTMLGEEIGDVLSLPGVGSLGGGSTKL